MKRILFLTIFLLLLVRLECRASNTINQPLITTIPSAIEIMPIDTVISGMINPENGVNSGVGARFSLKSNGKNKFYDYVLQASVLTKEGTTLNAYGNLGRSPFLIFGNISNSNLPTELSINNIKSNPQNGNNPNAIAYPVSATVENFRRIRFTTDNNYGGYCYKVGMGRNREGFINQQVGTNPVTGTYSYSEDKSGVYQVVITFSAFRKP